MQAWAALGRGSRWAGAVLVGAALTASAGAGRAEPAGTANAARPLILLVIPDSEATDVKERAAETIAAHVRRLSIELAVVHEPLRSAPRPPLDEPGILARARDLATERHACGVLWIGVGRGDLSLYLYARDGERLFSRRVPAERGQMSAAIESLALIAQSASAELLLGKVAAMTPVAPPAPAPADPPLVLAPVNDGGSARRGADLRPQTPVNDGGSARHGADLHPQTPVDAGSASVTSPVDDGGAGTPTLEQELPARPLTPEGPDHVPRRTTAGSIALAAGYVGNTGSRGVAWQSAFALEAGWHPSIHATLGIGYEIALPDIVAPGAGPAMEPAFSARHPLFVFGSYRLLLSSRWDVDLGGRTVVDFISHASARGLAGSPTEVRASVGPTAGLGLRLLPPLRLGLQVGMDVVLNPPGETLMRPSTISDRLQFVSALGLQLDLEPVGRDPPKVPRITASR